jgi:chromosome segregation ATPase
MNKSKVILIILLLLAGVVIVGEAAGIRYYMNQCKSYLAKYEDISKEIKTVEPGLKKLSQEKQVVEEKYQSLFKEYEAAKNDRDNLIIQAKTLLADRARAKELEVYIEKLKLQLEAAGTSAEELRKEGLGLQAKNSQLNESIKQLNQQQAQLEKEKEDLSKHYEDMLSTNLMAIKVKDLSAEIESSRKEKAAIDKQLRQMQAEADKMGSQNLKLSQQNEELSKALADYKKNYSEAQKKNAALENEIRGLPKKFAEVVRQNKILLKNTQKMHYNLGVFYTKEKEYERAISEFEKAIELKPDDASAHFNLGYIYAEYVVNRKKAVEHFRQYVRLAKGGDTDLDWAKKYILTWETYEGRQAAE